MNMSEWKNECSKFRNKIWWWKNGKVMLKTPLQNEHEWMQMMNAQNSILQDEHEWMEIMHAQNAILQDEHDWMEIGNEW
jgi:hypothetical protein